MPRDGFCCLSMVIAVRFRRLSSIDEHNRLIVWLYSYRNPEDLQLLERVKIGSRPLMAG